MYIKAAIGIVQSFPAFESPLDHYGEAIKSALGGLNPTTSITLIKSLSEYEELGQKVYDSFYSQLECESALPSAPQ